MAKDERVQIDWRGDIFLAAVEEVISEQLEKAGETVASKTRSLLRLRSNPDPPGNNPSPAGGPPAVQTGRLKGSIGVSKVSRYSRRVIGTMREGRSRTIEVGSGIKGTPVKYARIHELGGTIKVGGRVVIMPKRPYLVPALKDKTDRIRSLLGYKNIIERVLIRAARDMGGRV